jgi:hypothetical protein
VCVIVASVPPTWLTIIAWISVAAGFWSAAAVLYDIYGRGLRQPMRVMEAVWPITALYLGPLGWFAYAGLGRPHLKRDDDEPEWEGYAISGSHCGAGCALGDVIGEWVVSAGLIPAVSRRRDLRPVATCCNHGAP